MASSLNLEADAGISQFVSNHACFYGVTKQRYSDFLVSEISSDGTVVHLTSKDVIQPPSVAVIKDLKKPDTISDVQFEILKVIAGHKLAKELKPSLFMNTSSEKITFQKPPEDFTQMKIPVDGLSKESRTEIHQFIKSNFDTLNSSTKEFNNEKFIFVIKKVNDKQRDRSPWPKSQAYVNFVLYKENIDTMGAVNLIAGKLRMKPGNFSYAGTKDKRAKTSQMLSAMKVPPKNLSSVANSLHGLHVGNFSFSHAPQKLGQLKGNFFKIVLREVVGSDDVIDAAVSSLKNNGFINYYGMQRFSSADAPTHLIGKAILKCQWNKVIDLILLPRDKESSDLIDAKNIWKLQKDADAALYAILPYRRSTIEGLLLSGLVKHGKKNAITALERLPRNTRLLYLHAYQSFLWNTVVSRRIKKYGLKVLKGDIIRKNDKSSCITDDHNFEFAEEDLLIDDEENTGENTHVKEDITQNFKILSEEEADNVDITQILMPLPGYSIIYPENEIKTWYLELLQKDGLSFDSFQHKLKTYSLTGAYRRVIIRPENVKHEICFYNDPTMPLIPSDLDILENVDVRNNVLSAGKHKAVILEFSLPSSAYATMALRELLRIETSSAFQSTLNTKSNDSEPTIESTETSHKTAQNLKRKNDSANDQEDNADNDKKIKSQ